MENFATIFCIGLFTFYLLLLILLVWPACSSGENSTLRPRDQEKESVEVTTPDDAKQ